MRQTAKVDKSAKVDSWKKNRMKKIIKILQ